MAVALVTGSRTAGDPLAVLLRRRNYRVELSSECGCVPEVSGVSCYVQLPWSEEPGRAHHPRECLVSRLDLLAAVAPCLDARATVLLALDDTGRSGPSAELLQAMATVLLEDLGCDARVVVLPASQLAGGLDLDLTASPESEVLIRTA